MSTPPLPKGLDASVVHDVANRLHSVAIRLLRRARIADRETGLSPERLSLLSVLVYTGSRTLSELADIEQVSRPAISRSVKSLVSDGLVRRERGELDRRSVTLHATAAGRRLMETARTRRLERIAADYSALDPREIEILRRATDILQSLPDPPPVDPSTKKGT